MTAPAYLEDMTLPELAADLCRHVGEEFPAPVEQMRDRQYIHMVEEADEVIKALAGYGMRTGNVDQMFANVAKLREELADMALCTAMFAHYCGFDLDAAEAIAFPAFRPSYPDLLGSVAAIAGPLRRWQGYARRTGDAQPVTVAAGIVMLTVRQLAMNHSTNLWDAIREKAEVIYSRGWREPAQS